MSVTDPIFEPGTFEPAAQSAFGAIVSAFEVEQAVANSVRRWFRDYLAEIKRQRGLEVGRIPAFRSIVVSAELEKMPEDQLPALLIASPGLETAGIAGRRGGGRVEVHGDGGYVARFRVECAAVVSARGNRQALRLARLYAAAVRALLVQQQLHPTVLDVRRLDWLSEGYALLDSDADRTQGAGTVGTVVEVAEVTNRLLGPLEPMFSPTEPTEPPEPMEWPDARSAEVTVIKQEE